MPARSPLGRVTAGLDLVRSVAALVAGIALVGSSALALGPFAAAPGTASGLPALTGPASSGGLAVVPSAASSIIPPPTFPISGPSAPAAAARLTPSPPPSPPPISAATWFADGFDEPTGWPTGEAEFYTARVADSRYFVEPRPVDLPVYLWAATDGGPGSAVTIEATVTLSGEASLKAGVALGAAEDIDRIALLLHGSGAWELAVDDAEAYQTVLYGASGAIIGGSNRLRLMVDPNGTEIWLNGSFLGRTTAILRVARVGLSVLTRANGGQVVVDDVLVTVPG